MSNASGEQIYSTEEVPGKGYGLIATTTITRGTRILAESPLFTVPRHGDSKEHLRNLILQEIAALSEDQRKSFLSLHNSFEDTDGPLLGRVRTNALPLGSNAETGGIFPQASRINHSCDQNAQNTWNENIQQLTIHAIREIVKGEEITIFYLNDRRNRNDRLQNLQKSFRFSCSCRLCTLPLDQRQKSDERWDEIQRLDHSIGNGVGIMFTPLETLYDVRKLLSLLNDEDFADASVPRAYYDAFQIAIVHGDAARAKVFAERAAATRTILEGYDSSTAQRMEALANNPCQHRAHGTSGKWRTVVDDIPRDIGEREFERWLWRMEAAVDPQYANLRDPSLFPAFNDLPGENDANLSFCATADGFSYHPRGNWCFLAEITEISNFVRLNLSVKDKNDLTVPLIFYTDERGRELSPSSVKEGFTVALLYAEQHGFLDLSIGVRHENPATIKIFPFKLGVLLTLSDRIQQYATQSGGLRVCHGCDQKSASLQKCSRCGMFWYCNQLCQTVGWNEQGHKADCKLLKSPDLKGLFITKWNIFANYLQFPLG